MPSKKNKRNKNVCIIGKVCTEIFQYVFEMPMVLVQLDLKFVNTGLETDFIVPADTHTLGAN